MTVYKADETFDRSLLAGASCAFGVFDGLHVGHRYLIGQAASTKQPGGRAIALTFDIDPDEVFHADRLTKLMRNADRIAALAAAEVDDVVVIPFDESLYTQSPDSFLQSAFPAGAPAHMHVGEDFRFGARAAGTVETLQEWGSRVGCQVHPHRLVSADDAPITATRIRKLLADCDLDEANRLLGHPYSLRETVQRGRGDGANFGFATANLQVKRHDRVLGEGVYAAYAIIDGVRYKSAASVGVSPTFEATSTANMEIHVLDFAGDLVGKDIVVEFVTYLRPMMKFDSTEELIATVMSNIQWVRENL
ncbi:MAG TPA: riboflavin biosynthesis protein RibF [Eggerthellaceae bacterium]|nr:riboflavin biosynthesis protein RibF [Eggerthellaceae bacterium]